MSKNEKIDIKSEKEQLNDKRKAVNRKQKNENKCEEKADENSNAFPNFSVLNKEERLAFFKALSTARKNAEKRGLPTRKRFGTVHDEYLKYFNENEKDEEEDTQQEVRCTRSNFTRGGQSDTPTVLLENSKFSLKATTGTPKKTFSSAERELRAREQPESIIEAETNELVNLFLKKKKRYEKEVEKLQPCETASGNERLEDMKKEKSPVLRELETPQFDALNKEEKDVFFKILEKAHSNAVEKNTNKEQNILPLNAILRSYRPLDDVAAVFTTTQDTLNFGKSKKNLKVTVTVTSKDNERLLMEHCQMQKDVAEEYSGKHTQEKVYPVDVSIDERDKKDEEFCETDKIQVKELDESRKRNDLDSEGKNAAEVESSRSELWQISSGSLEFPPTNKDGNFCRNKNEKLLNTKEMPTNSESEESTPIFSSASFCSFDKNLVEPEGNNSGGADEAEDWSVSVEESKSQCSSKEVEPWEEVSESCLERQEPKKPEESEGESRMIETGSQDGLSEISFVTEKPKEDASEKHISKRSSKEKDLPLARVMLVDDDVVEKIKKLICYLETKVRKDSRLEEEYLKLLVDYTAYLAKVLESLILKEEAQKKQCKNKCLAAGFGLYCENFKNKNEKKPESFKSELVSDSANTSKAKRSRSFEETGEATSKDRESDLILPVLSDSENTSDSEGETRVTHEKGDTEKILRTKIRLLQDLLRQRAEFVEGTLGDFRIVRPLRKTSVHEEKPPTVQLLPEDEPKAEKENEKKFLNVFIRCCRCGKVEKLSEEKLEEKDPSLELIKANERKKIMEKYFDRQ